jgi:hypothetical protein
MIITYNKFPQNVIDIHGVLSDTYVPTNSIVTINDKLYTVFNSQLITVKFFNYSGLISFHPEDGLPLRKEKAILFIRELGFIDKKEFINALSYKFKILEYHCETKAYFANFKEYSPFYAK